MTVITQNIADIAGASDGTAWVFYTPQIRESSGGGIVSTKKVRKYPTDGVLTVELDPGPAVVIAADGKHYPFIVPEEDAELWPLIQAAVAIPPTTTQEKLSAAVSAWLQHNQDPFDAAAAAWLTENPPDPGPGVDSVTLDGTELVASVQGVEVGRADLGPFIFNGSIDGVTDATATGKSIVRAANAAAARTAINAEAAGATKTADQISDATATGRAIVRAATAAAAREAMAAASTIEVSDAVADAVADAGTVVSAAAAAAADAVTADIAGRDILESSDPRVPQSFGLIDDWAYAITDSSNRVALGVDDEGRTFLNLRDDTDIPRSPSEASAHDTVYTIEDQDGRVALSVQGDGTVHIPKLLSPNAVGGNVGADSGRPAIETPLPGWFRYTQERPELVVFDHFRRADDATDGSATGRSDCGAYWTAPGFALTARTLRTHDNAGGLKVAVLQCPIRDVRVRAEVSVGATHDFGIVACHPSAHDTPDALLYARFSKFGSGASDQVSIVFAGAAIASGAPDFGFSGDTDLVCEVEVRGSTITAYVNGELAVSHTLTSGQLAVLAGHSDVGVVMNSTGGRDSDTRLCSIEVSHTRARTELQWPRLYVHRGSFDFQAECSTRPLAYFPAGRAIGIEVDTQVTADGHIILLHDATLDRTTNATGSPSEMTLQQIQQVTINEGGGPIPLLSEYLEAAAQTAGLREVVVNWKTGTPIAETLGIMEASPFGFARTIFATSDGGALAAARALSADVRLSGGSLTADNATAKLATGASVGMDYILLANGSVEDTDGAVLSVVPSFLAEGIEVGLQHEHTTDAWTAALAAGCTVNMSDESAFLNR